MSKVKREKKNLKLYTKKPERLKIHTRGRHRRKAEADAVRDTGQGKLPKPPDAVFTGDPGGESKRAEGYVDASKGPGVESQH